MKKWQVVVLMCLMIPALLFTVSCQKKVSAQNPLAKSVSVQAKPSAPATQQFAASVPDFMTEKIYFDYDKSILTKESQLLLQRKATWLKDNPSARVLIEGNCDERGTNEYNMALGERRAQAANRYLVDVSGINPDRIKTISYGEERPTCKEPVESCWKKNRNDNFVVFK